MIALVFVFFVPFVVIRNLCGSKVLTVSNGKGQRQSWYFLLWLSLINWLPALVGMIARIAVSCKGMRRVWMDFLDCRPVFRCARSLLFSFAAFFGAMCAVCLAQQPVIGSAPVQPAATPAGQKLLEAGDVYLPNSRVYVFV